MAFYPIIVCGGRDYADRIRVFETLDGLRKLYGPLHVIQGGASGADRLAREWALAQSYTYMSNVPADWDAHGKAAGPIRNQKMIEEYHPKLVVAFPGGRGTADMIKRAREAGIEVQPIEAAHEDSPVG